MKKNFAALLAFAFSFTLLLTACGDKKESASSIARQWCDLNEKVYKADDASKASAEADRRKFEDDMNAKYKDNKAFLEEIGQEVEKCEDASEGRK